MQRSSRVPHLLVALTLAWGCAEPTPSSPPEPDAAPEPEPEPPTALRVEVSEPPTADCELGRVVTRTGLDDGTPGGISANGTLEMEEVDSERYACRDTPDPALLAPAGLDQLPADQPCRPLTGPSDVSGAKLTSWFLSVEFPANPACNAPWNALDCRRPFRPVAMVQAPDTSEHYLAEQTGRVLVFSGAPGAQTARVALDLSDKVVFGYEPGLLAMDFDPLHTEHVFLTYITCTSQAATPPLTPCADGEGLDVYLVVSRFTRAPDGSIDPMSEQLVLEQRKPRTEHNGGGARFGPDGMLFVALGDGGDFPSRAAQDPRSLLGKILRLDVHDERGAPLGSDRPYRVPADNPYAAATGTRPEIYAMGLRNPWRYDFAPWTQGPVRLWVADVGLVTAEEIDLVEPGGNYGWPDMEGTYCRPTGDDAVHTGVLLDRSCNLDGRYDEPVYSYSQGRGVSIIGGFVYRGQALPWLAGELVFTDLSRSALWSLRQGAAGPSRRWLTESNRVVTSFAEDLDGELYTLDWWTGDIARLVPTQVGVTAMPARLSATGCVRADAPLLASAAAIPFSPMMPFFSEEGVVKSRYLFLPPGLGLTEYADTGTLIVPPGSVLMKHFDYAGQRIETRLFVRHSDGGWSGWSYRWLADQSDAVLAAGGERVTLRGLTWDIPERGDCYSCHTNVTGRVLGLRVQQLNGLAYYPATGRWANQLDTLRHLGRIDRVVATDASRPIADDNARIVPLPAAGALPSFPRLTEHTRPLRERVGAYLEANCAHCHQPAGGGRGNFDLRATSFLRADVGVCEVIAQSDVYADLSEQRLVKPGLPDQSILLRRLEEQRPPYRMHPYRAGVDEAGAALLRQWISQSAAEDCPAP